MKPDRIGFPFQKTAESSDETRTAILRKQFSDLSAEELYQILKARVDVFVVEQNCPYPEIDGKDPDAWHLWLMVEDRHTGVQKMAGYLRCFPADESGRIWQIGRVLTLVRSKGYGRKLLHEAIRQIEDDYHPEQIVLEAQTYAVPFYQKEGFVPCGEPFLEDGIPHIRMIRTG